jgi:hypothetical protein
MRLLSPPPPPGFLVIAIAALFFWRKGHLISHNALLCINKKCFDLASQGLPRGDMLANCACLVLLASVTLAQPIPASHVVGAAFNGLLALEDWFFSWYVQSQLHTFLLS